MSESIIYFKLLFKEIFNIERRISRKKYTTFILLFFFCCFTIDILDRTLSFHSNTDNIFYWLYSIVITFLTLIFFVINGYFYDKKITQPKLKWMVVYMVFFTSSNQIALCFFKGTHGPNSYGELP